MTWGNHKWKGAAPSFKRRAIRSKVEVKVEEKIIIHVDKMIMVDPKAWIKKYFKAASEK